MESAARDLPKLWFDPTGGYSDMPGDGDNDCDCDCRGDSASLSLRSTQPGTTIALAWEQRLRQRQPLHMQALGTGYWLLADPLGTGRVAVLDDSCRAVFEQFRAPTTIGEAAQYLTQWDIDVISATANQLVQLGLLETTTGNRPQPAHFNDTLTAWLHITNSCPLRCHYCYLHKTEDHMDLEVAYQSVNAVIRSAIRNGFRRIKLKYAGGEAGTRAATVFAVHDYARDQTQRNGLELEAVLLSSGVGVGTGMLAGLHERGIRLMISLDGVGADHDAQRQLAGGKGSFAIVDGTIRRALTCGLTPFISVTVSARNLAGLPNLMNYLLDHELPFSINYYRENTAAVGSQSLRYGEQEMIAAMRSIFAIIEQRLPRRSLLGCLVDRADLRTPHQQPCGVGDNYLVIDQHGGVAKCQMEIERPVTTIALVDPLQALRADTSGLRNLPVDQRDGCKTCLWRYWCAGGCPALTYQVTGRYDIKSPNCGIYTSLYPDVLRLEGLRLLAHIPAWTALAAETV